MKATRPNTNSLLLAAISLAIPAGCGRGSWDQLLAHGADTAFDDLGDAGSVLRAIPD